MKKKAIAVLLCVLALTVLGGFTVGGSGLREHYAGLLERGIITEAECGKLEAYGFELPESGKEPLDDFSIGEIATANGDVVER